MDLTSRLVGFIGRGASRGVQVGAQVGAHCPKGIKYGVLAGAGALAYGASKLDKWSAGLDDKNRAGVVTSEEAGDIWPNPDPAVSLLERKCFHCPKGI